MLFEYKLNMLYECKNIFNKIDNAGKLMIDNVT